MTLARTHGVTLAGVHGQLVEIECDLSAGLPGLSFTGLADTAVMESRDRIRSAIVNCGAKWPNRRITVALFPADVRKVGSRLDLAVAVAVLAAADVIPSDRRVSSVAWIAELGLDGRLRGVRGVLPSVIAARQAGLSRIVVARSNAAEAALVPDMDVRWAETLGDVHRFLAEGTSLPGAESIEPEAAAAPDERLTPDLADVAGQFQAKRALEIAAAGGHHIYFVGSPGSGKTMLAERLPGILPPLTDDQAMEVTGLHSVSGALGRCSQLVRRPPWQAPHHTASVASLVGGGAHLARPGAISLAHHGVLFLDEAAEFAPAALDSLRQPLESGQVTLSRTGATVTYPARFQLVMAANPCPCALPSKDCTCSPLVLRRHAHRLSGPLLDRIDLRLQVQPVLRADLFDRHTERETSATVAARVARARTIAAQRWRATPWRVNAQIPGAVLRSAGWMLDRKVLRSAEECLETGGLTARGFDRVLRLAWTIADLDGCDAPDVGHVDEALAYRTGGSSTWAA